MTELSPIEKLDNIFSQMDGLTCYALVNESRRIMRPLAPLGEVAYACGQMACLLAAHFKRRRERETTGSIEWVSSTDVLPRTISIDQLYHEVGQPASDTVRAALLAAWYGHWPDGSKMLSGYKSASLAMSALGRVTFQGRWNPVADLTGQTGTSLRTRLTSALKEFEACGLPLHNEQLLRTMHEYLGYCHLLAVGEVAAA